MKSKDEMLKEWDEEEFLLKCYTDFSFFFTEVLGFIWDSFLEEVYLMIERGNKVCVIAPRGHGKTTLFLSYILWYVTFNKEKSVLLVAYNREQALSNLSTLTDMIEENELLSEILKPSRIDTWRKTELLTKTRCRILVRTNNKSIRGGHHDIVMCDEAGEYQDLGNYYAQVIPTVFAKNGKIAVIGTPTSKIDLLAELSQSEDYISKTFRALDAFGNPLTKRFPKEKLEEVRKSYEEKGRIFAWEQEFMCNPTSEQASLINYNDIVAGMDKEAVMLIKGESNKRYFLGADFAMSQRASADFTVFTVIEVDEHNNRRIVRIEREKGASFNTQIERFKRVYKDFGIRRAVVDESNIGKVFFDLLKEEGLIITGCSFKSDLRNDLLIGMATLFENRKVFIPYSKEDMYTYNNSHILIQELMSMVYKPTSKLGNPSWHSASRHDDCVMSLALALEATGKDYGNVSISAI